MRIVSIDQTQKSKGEGVKIPTCINCKYYNHIDSEFLSKDVCVHPNIGTPEEDYVLGGFMYTYTECRRVRRDENLCGRSGRWFEKSKFFFCVKIAAAAIVVAAIFAFISGV